MCFIWRFDVSESDVGVFPSAFLNGDLTALTADERKARIGAVT